MALRRKSAIREWFSEWRNSLLLASVGVLLCFATLLDPFFVIGKCSYDISAFLEFSEKLGDAFIIASLLAFTVDSYLKKRLIEDISPLIRGAHLPIELRREIDKIVRTELYRSDFEQTYKFEYIDASEEHIRLTTITNFFVNNPSSSPCPFEYIVWMDKLDYIPNQDLRLIRAGASGVLDSDKKPEGYDRFDLKFGPTAEGDAFEWKRLHYIPVSFANQVENSAGQARFWYETSQIFQSQDEMTFYSLCATVRHRISVAAPNNLVVNLTIGYSNEDAIQKIPNKEKPTVWYLPVALLPMSAMTVNWHKSPLVPTASPDPSGRPLAETGS
jgi:hypothetical protein